MGHITAIQTNSSDDIDSNLTKLSDCIVEACGAGPDHGSDFDRSPERDGRKQDETGDRVIVLPECFGLMPSSIAQLLQCAEMDCDGKIQNFLSETALGNNIWIVGGSVPMRSADPEKITNSLLVYNNHGERVARYDKIFLFDVSLASGERYCESDYTLPGNRCDVIDTPVGRMGLSVCYDLRFPELYRRLVQKGAEILVVPSAFAHTTGQDHWMPLLKARAIENSCYVVAPAQYGEHNKKRKTWGHTVIIDPWGNTAAELETGWGSVHSRINLEALSRIRKQLPSLQHCRFDLF